MADDQLSMTFAALADPTRRAILARLAGGGDGQRTGGPLRHQCPGNLEAPQSAQACGTHHPWPRRPVPAVPIRISAPRASHRLDRETPTGLERTFRPTRATPERYPTTTERDRAMNDTRTTLGEITYTRVYDAPRDLVFRCMI